jgi:hypothetical protein
MLGASVLKNIESESVKQSDGNINKRATNTQIMLDTSDVILPKIDYEIIYNVGRIPDDILLHILTNHKKYTIVVASSETSVISYIKELTTAAGGSNYRLCMKMGILVYKYTNRSNITYTSFSKTGGLLITTAKIIVEGNNLNHCDLMVNIFDEKCFLVFSRCQQLIGRIKRQSSVATSIRVVSFVINSVMCARMMILRVDCNGFDVHEIRTHGLQAKVKRLYNTGLWKLLTDIELLGLLGYFTNNIDSERTLNFNDFYLSRESYFKILLGLPYN